MKNISNAMLILCAVIIPYLFEVGYIGELFMIVIAVLGICTWEIPTGAKEKLGLINTQAQLNIQRSEKNISERRLNESKKTYYLQKAHYYRCMSEDLERKNK